MVRMTGRLLSVCVGLTAVLLGEGGGHMSKDLEVLASSDAVTYGEIRDMSKSFETKVHHFSGSIGTVTTSNKCSDLEEIKVQDVYKSLQDTVMAMNKFSSTGAGMLEQLDNVRMRAEIYGFPTRRPCSMAVSRVKALIESGKGLHDKEKGTLPDLLMFWQAVKLDCMCIRGYIHDMSPVLEFFKTVTEETEDLEIETCFGKINYFIGHVAQAAQGLKDAIKHVVVQIDDTMNSTITEKGMDGAGYTETDQHGNETVNGHDSNRKHVRNGNVEVVHMGDKNQTESEHANEYMAGPGGDGNGDKLQSRDKNMNNRHLEPGHANDPEEQHGKTTHGENTRGGIEHRDTEHDENGHGETAHGETEHGEIDHGETDHGETEHGETEHRETEHGENDHGETDHSETDHGETDHGETDHGETHHREPDHGETDHSETDHGETDHGETDHGENNYEETGHGDTITVHGHGDQGNMDSELYGNEHERTENKGLDNEHLAVGDGEEHN